MGGVFIPAGVPEATRGRQPQSSYDGNRTQRIFERVGRYADGSPMPGHRAYGTSRAGQPAPKRTTSSSSSGRSRSRGYGGYGGGGGGGVNTAKDFEKFYGLASTLLGQMPTKSSLREHLPGAVERSRQAVRDAYRYSVGDANAFEGEWEAPTVRGGDTSERFARLAAVMGASGAAEKVEAESAARRAEDTQSYASANELNRRAQEQSNVEAKSSKQAMRSNALGEVNRDAEAARVQMSMTEDQMSLARLQALLGILQGGVGTGVDWKKIALPSWAKGK